MAKVIQYASSDDNPGKLFLIQLAKERPDLVTPRYMLGLLENNLLDMKTLQDSAQLHKQILAAAAAQDPQAPYHQYKRAAGKNTRRIAKFVAATSVLVGGAGLATHLHHNHLLNLQGQKLFQSSQISGTRSTPDEALSPTDAAQVEELIQAARDYEKILHIEGAVVLDTYFSGGIGGATALAMWLISTLIQSENAAARLRKSGDDPKAREAFMQVVEKIEPLLQAELTQQQSKRAL